MAQLISFQGLEL